MGNQKEGQGFQTIGNLTKNAFKQPLKKGTPKIKSEGFGNASQTTGVVYLGKRGVNSTGTQHGEITSVEILLADKLAEMAPSEASKDILTRLRPSSLRSIMKAEIINSEYEIIGYRRLDMTPGEAAEALEIVRQYQQPAPREKVISALAEKRLMTKSKSDEVQTEAALLRIYANLFDDVPADVTRAVLNDFHKIEKGWWPSAFAVEEQIKLYGGGRKQMALALARAAGIL